MKLKEKNQHSTAEHPPRSPQAMETSRNIRLELTLLCLTAIALTLVAAQYDALEMLIDWAMQYEEYEIDEVITLLIFLAFAFGIFAVRRVIELRQHIRLRDSAEQQMYHIAMHDALTGLPNRHLFTERLKQELARAEREGSHVAVFILDLDKFKQVNEVYGHHSGDGLLMAAASRLKGAIRQMDTVARLGGDEFAVIQPGLGQPSDATQLGNRIVQAFNQPIEFEGRQFASSTSVGVTIADGSHAEPAELLRAADIAMYRAKEEGGAMFRFFETDMDSQLRARQHLEEALRHALEQQSLALHFQPLFTVRAPRLIGFEALLRWEHPELGMISPAEFIPIAEDCGLITQIGEWVLHEASRTAAQWPDDITIAVNVSSLQFKVGNFIEVVESALGQSGLPAERLEIEITESVLIQDTENARRILTRLKALGVRIAMDDFGTGYSSLSYLRTFPFDKIKIDRSFITELEQNQQDAAIIKAVVDMGRTLGMAITAEGIETRGQLDSLSIVGCDQAQGFFLGHPADKTQTEKLLPNPLQATRF